MANSRELAEQAFSLLQDALKDSEARAAELDAQLRKERTPRNAVEEQALVLGHRMESVEAEREHWKREAAQLAEVLENERAKLRKLKKKLEIAESGPNSVEKKEVNFWRSRAEEFDKDTREYKQRIAALRKELNGRPEAGDAIDTAVLEQLETTRQEAHELRAAAAALKADADRMRSEAARLETELAGQKASAAKSEAVVAELRTAAADAAKARAHAEDLVRERDGRLAEQTARIAALSAETADLRSKLGSNDTELSELESRLSERVAECSRLKAAGDELGQSVESLSSARERLDQELTARHAEISGLHQELAAARRQLADNDDEKRSIREQIAGLEDELKEEKECTVNLSQLANERHEQITVLSEKLDEALERFAEAKWKLERAGVFERLVAKRRTLIASLLETIRSKQKSNTALKAGIDGLRKFKAKSEQQQQKLLVRIEDLTAEIKDIHERNSGKETGERLRKAEDNVTSLETRLEAQAKLIETLESDLSSARASRQAAENHSRELAEIRATVEKKDATIELLKADLDEQQKQLGKLRGSESETIRLKAVTEKDQSLIGDLENEIKELNEELNRLRQAAEGGANDSAAAASADIRRRDAQISDLKRLTKDQEKEIARLKEAVAGWQKKYEFLSAEPPSAYQSSAPAEKAPPRN